MLRYEAILERLCSTKEKERKDGKQEARNDPKGFEVVGAWE